MNTTSNFSNNSIKWASIVSICFALLLAFMPNSVQAQNAPDEVAGNPSITIEHAAVDAYVLPGETAAFTVAVTNTGDIRLENVRVSNTSAPDCARTIGTMEPNQAVAYTCEVANVNSAITSRATVIGAPANNPLVVATATVTVDIVSPVLAIIKNPAQGQARGGERIVMTYNYENSGTGAAVGVQLVEIVPENTYFMPDASAAGWACENDAVEAGTVCYYSIDIIQAGDSATGQFPFVVMQEADDEIEESIVSGSASPVAPQQLITLFLPLING